jgi:ferredoxin
MSGICNHAAVNTHTRSGREDETRGESSRRRSLVNACWGHRHARDCVGCGTCQDSRYNVVKHEYYTLHIDKDTYYVSRYKTDIYYISRYSIVKHEYYTLHIDIDTYYVNGSGIHLYL